MKFIVILVSLCAVGLAGYFSARVEIAYEQRELMRMVLCRAEVNEREITLVLYALDGDRVRMPPDWLPGKDSNLRPSG